MRRRRVTMRPRRNGVVLSVVTVRNTTLTGTPMRHIQPALAYASHMPTPMRRTARPRMPAKGLFAAFDGREEAVCVDRPPVRPRVGRFGGGGAVAEAHVAAAAQAGVRVLNGAKPLNDVAPFAEHSTLRGAAQRA